LFSFNSRIVGKPESYPETVFEEVNGDLREADFGPDPFWSPSLNVTSGLPIIQDLSPIGEGGMGARDAPREPGKATTSVQPIQTTATARS
jgi:hypothetical protein